MMGEYAENWKEIEANFKKAAGWYLAGIRLSDRFRASPPQVVQEFVEGRRGRRLYGFEEAGRRRR